MWPVGQIWPMELCHLASLCCLEVSVTHRQDVGHAWWPCTAPTPSWHPRVEEWLPHAAQPQDRCRAIEQQLQGALPTVGRSWWCRVFAEETWEEEWVKHYSGVGLGPPPVAVTPSGCGEGGCCTLAAACVQLLLPRLHDGLDLWPRPGQPCQGTSQHCMRLVGPLPGSWVLLGPEEQEQGWCGQHQLFCLQCTWKWSVQA